MPKNSKDNSLMRYREMEMISARYLEALSCPKPRIMMSAFNKKRAKLANDYIKAFNETMRSLDREYRDFINYSFIEKEALPYLKEQYSMATFYRRRDKSIREFIQRFNP